MNMDRRSPDDHYRTLGLARDASTREIRRAYRRLARQHHPDVNPADDAGRFVAITDAYQILSDPTARTRYDQTLAAASPPATHPRRAGAHHGRPDRVGVLELSADEAAYLARNPLTLTDGTTTIRLPAGLGHGQTITLREQGVVARLLIRVRAWT
jgi:DnaJ-class molecular chaperone